MTSRSFRRLFPQLNIQSIPEDEFYRQASLSQLLTGPDQQELASFRPDIKDPLELVEATPELAGMLGSSLEFVDTRWDSLEASPPPTPSSMAELPAKRLVLRPAQLFTSLLQKHHQGTAEVGAALAGLQQNESTNYSQYRGFKNLEYSIDSAKTSDKNDTYMGQQQRQINTSPLIPAKLDVKLNASMWEPHRQPHKLFTTSTTGTNSDSGLWKRQLASVGGTGPPACRDANNATHLSDRQNITGKLPSADFKVESSILLDKMQQGVGCFDPNDKSRQAVSGTQIQSEAHTDKDCPEPATTNEQNHDVKHDNTADSVESATALDIRKWEWQEANLVRGATTAAKREANFCHLGRGAKVIKMDAGWPKNLGNVRVHIRDLGMNLDPPFLRQDANIDPSRNAEKGPRVKSRS